MLIEIIVLIVFVLYFNSRLNKIESYIEKGTFFRKNEGSVPNTTPSVKPLDIKTLSQTPESTLNSQIPQSPDKKAVISQNISQKTESGEESAGRILGRIGIIAVIIGIVFFLKYAFDNDIIGVTGRIVLGLLAGIGFIGLGTYLRNKYATYGDLLIAGGIGVLYLTTYAAYDFYHLIDVFQAYVFMTVVTVFAVTLSLVFDNQYLALGSMAIAFLTPLMIGGDNSNYIAYLVYYLILDIGVLAVSFKNKWRRLFYLAFIGTMLMAGPAIMNSYPVEDRGIRILFSTLFFTIFLYGSIAHHIIRKVKSDGLDLALVGANALAYFYSFEYFFSGGYSNNLTLGFIALGLSLLYILVSLVSWSTDAEDKALNIFLPGLSVLFITLAIPLILNGNWITVAWFIESVFLVLAGLRIKRHGIIVYGIVIYGVSVFSVMTNVINLTGSFCGSDAFCSSGSFNGLMSSIYLYVIAICVTYLFSVVFKDSDEIVFGQGTSRTFYKHGVLTFFFIAQCLTIFSITDVVNRVYEMKRVAINSGYSEEIRNGVRMYGQSSGIRYGEISQQLTANTNQNNTVINIIWAVYAMILIAIGFAKNNSFIRKFGLVFFFITAIKVFIDVWNIGELYRIISSIVFGVVALLASFGYAKYKDRIKEII